MLAKQERTDNLPAKVLRRSDIAVTTAGKSVGRRSRGEYIPSTPHGNAGRHVGGKRTDWWFDSGDEPLEAARAVCEPCPIRRECLAYALESPELVGSWGGTDERERRQMRMVSA